MGGVVKMSQSVLLTSAAACRFSSYSFEFSPKQEALPCLCLCVCVCVCVCFHTIHLCPIGHTDLYCLLGCLAKKCNTIMCRFHSYVHTVYDHTYGYNTAYHIQYTVLYRSRYRNPFAQSPSCLVISGDTKPVV